MTGCLDDETVLGLIEGRATGLENIEDHLDGCESCRALVAGMARAQSPSSSPSLSPSPSLSLERGAAIGPGGRYVIGELLGSGAMGNVYSAWQPELDRRVAIKILRDDATHGRDHLIREAKAMAKLDHPNVVGVHEVGSLGDGGVFVVMDLVEGDTLRAWAQTPNREWRELARLFVEIARGLAAVHATGVIHRDIKPDNIIIGADGRARLGDFGLARGANTKTSGRLADSVSFEDTVVAIPSPHTASQPAASESTRPLLVGGAMATPEGASSGTAVAGTPVYMAPEVLRGGAATAASDQFAFGVTAYEAIAGKRPFTGATWTALACAAETTTPPALEVPGWLDAAIRRCLAVDPARRFGSMTEVADHLADRAQRRRSGVWIAGAATAAIVASGVTWVAVRGNDHIVGPTCTLGAAEISSVWNPSVRERLPQLGAPTLAAIDGWATKWAGEHDAVCAAATTQPAPKVAARQQCLIQQRTELDALLARALSSEPDPVASPPTATGEISERMLDAVAALSPDDCRFAEPGSAEPVPADPVRAKTVRDVERELPAARAAIALGDARPVLASTVGLVSAAATSGHAPTLAEALLVRADALRASAQLPEAAIAARDALAAAERGHDDQRAARAWVARVQLAADRRDLTAADDLAAIAGAAIDRAGASPRLFAQLVRLRAQIAYNRGRYDMAMMLLADAFQRFKTLSGERSLDIAGIQSALGSASRASGDLEMAENYHRAALAIDRELRGAHHPDIARDLHNIAGVLRLRGDLDGAFATYNEALAVEVAIRGEHSTQAGLTHNSLGLVKLARKDFPGARAEFELALAVLTAAGSGDRAFAEHNLGLVAAAAGDHAAALASYDRAAAIFDATVGGDLTSSIRIHLDRARSLLATRQRDAARAEANRAIEAATRVNIPWIIEDARALLAPARSASTPNPAVTIELRTGPAHPPGRVVDPPGPGPTMPGPAVPGPAVPDPPKPPTKPKRDVGSYGAGQP